MEETAAESLSLVVSSCMLLSAAKTFLSHLYHCVMMAMSKCIDWKRSVICQIK